MCSIHLQHTVDSHMRRRIHACHMRRRIHACHMKRKIHACHMRRRIHLLTRPWTLTTDPSFICTGFTLGETSGSVFEATNLSGSVSEAFILSVRARVSKASFIAVLSARACSRLRGGGYKHCHMRRRIHACNMRVVRARLLQAACQRFHVICGGGYMHCVI